MYLTSKIQIFRIKKEMFLNMFSNLFTQVGVKQLTDFLRTVTAASDFVDCTLVKCELCVVTLPRFPIASCCALFD